MEGLRLNLGQDEPYYGGAASAARLCYLGYRTREMAEIWRRTLPADRQSRLITVVSAQFVWSLTSDKILSCNDTYTHVDVLGIAPYFGNYDQRQDTDLDVLMASLQNAIEDDTAQIAEHKAIADQYQVKRQRRCGTGPCGVTTNAALPNFMSCLLLCTP